MNQAHNIKQHHFIEGNEGIQNEYSIPLIQKQMAPDDAIEAVMGIISDYLKFQNLLAIRQYELQGEISDDLKSEQEHLANQKQHILSLMKTAKNQNLNIHIDAQINISFIPE